MMDLFENIPVSQPALIGNEKKYIEECLNSTWISSSGKFIKLFEHKFAEYIGAKYGISCSNGTVALHLALLALGIGPGDEVIVPSLTFIATANSVLYTGARPIFVDCEEDTWNIDPNKIQGLITPKTKAIIAVHLYGHPCEMDHIKEIAKKRELSLVEDAAEAIGSSYRGKRCGSIGDISTFSFYGNKTITTGEGGMVLTNDKKLAEKVTILKTQGVDPRRRYWFTKLGYNYRMTNIQAGIGFAQLENVDKFLYKRRQIARWYNDNLSGYIGLTLPVERNHTNHSYWMYSILIESEFKKSRNEVINHLASRGIETRPFFYPMHTMPVHRRKDLLLEISERISRKGINLPTFYQLEKKQVDYICKTLLECS